jgi:hypothetical protein
MNTRNFTDELASALKAGLIYTFCCACFYFVFHVAAGFNISWEQTMIFVAALSFIFH